MKAEHILENGYRWVYYPAQNADRVLLMAELNRKIIISACAKYFVRKNVGFLVLPEDPVRNAAPGLHSREFDSYCSLPCLENADVDGILKLFFCQI